MADRYRTRDGQQVGLGDQVWSQNHWPWLIVGVEQTRLGDWVLMEHHEVSPDTLRMLELDFPIYMYKSHPPDDCHTAGCQHRPWGAR